MLFDVFQCIKNVLAQFDTVESSTVSRKMSRTTVKHDVAFNPGSPIKRCFLVVLMLISANNYLQIEIKIIANYIKKKIIKNLNAISMFVNFF